MVRAKLISVFISTDFGCTLHANIQAVGGKLMRFTCIGDRDWEIFLYFLVDA